MAGQLLNSFLVVFVKVCDRKAQQRDRSAGNVGRQGVQGTDVPVLRQKAEHPLQDATRLKTDQYPHGAGQTGVVKQTEQNGWRDTLHGKMVAQ